LLGIFFEPEDEGEMSVAFQRIIWHHIPEHMYTKHVKPKYQ
jgi:hypothetical protein